MTHGREPGRSGRRFAAAAALTAEALSTGGAGAQSLPADAVCAVEQAVACSADDACRRSLPSAVNLPVLFRLDFDESVAVSRNERGDERRSPISSVIDLEEAFLLQGTDAGNGWSMRIGVENGRFVLARSHAQVGYVAFGVCSSALAQ